MSKAEQVAKRRYPQRLHSALHHAGCWAVRAGVAWALPEKPDDAVIEAMAKGVFVANNDAGWALADWDGDWLSEATRDIWRRYARAAYAALREAMQ